MTMRGSRARPSSPGWPNVPAESALNHAASSALAAGRSIDRDELVVPSLVVGVIAKAAVEPVII